MFKNLQKPLAVALATPEAPAVLDLAPGPAQESLATAGSVVIEVDANQAQSDTELAPKGPNALPVRFGSTQVKLSAPDGFPHLVERRQDTTVSGYDVYLLGDIYYDRAESRPLQHLVQLLDHATEDQVFTFFIASRGGHISAMAAIVSAMKRTKARTITIAVGPVMSAATVIWWAGQERRIQSGAVFMFHFSSHGDYGTSRGIKQRADALIQYVQEKLLDPMVKEQLLTDMEMSTILNGEDVFIPAMVMQARLAAVPPTTTTVVVPADVLSTTDETAAPADSEPEPTAEPAPDAETSNTEETANVG